jgi:hypothetical protein
MQPLPCPHCPVTLSELERRAEIDMRVGTLLAKREVERYQYQRGFWDCLCFVIAVVSMAILFWPEIKSVTKGGK